MKTLLTLFFISGYIEDPDFGVPVEGDVEVLAVIGEDHRPDVVLLVD